MVKSASPFTSRPSEGESVLDSQNVGVPLGGGECVAPADVNGTGAVRVSGRVPRHTPTELDVERVGFGGAESWGRFESVHHVPANEFHDRRYSRARRAKQRDARPHSV